MKKTKKKCTSCIYRGNQRDNGCDYLLITGHSRGCPVAKCSVYVKGPSIRRNKKPFSCGEGQYEH